MKNEELASKIFFIFHFSFFIKLWASRFAEASPPLASGYPLHHPLRAFHALCGWFRFYPSRFARAKPVQLKIKN
jgi:hypothetical protein